MQQKEFDNLALKPISVITIIVPCYNQAQYLSETLDSVISQTYTNWECIIINDGSTDNTAEVANEYVLKDNRFKYLYKDNGGLSSARNSGIKIAEGEYILPLDADDLISPAYIELALKAFDSDTDLALVYCKAKRFGYDNQDWDLPPYTYKGLLTINSIFCSAVFRRSEWEIHNGYDEQLKKGWEDWDFWLQILSPESKVYQLPQVLFHYRTKEVSMITSFSTEDQEITKMYIYGKHLKAYQTQFNSPITCIHEYVKLEEENEYLRRHVDSILSSKSYQIGNFILTPFSFIKNIVKKYS